MILTLMSIDDWKPFDDPMPPPPPFDALMLPTVEHMSKPMVLRCYIDVGSRRCLLINVDAF